MLTIFSYDNPQIIAGQGTIGLEILEQVEDIDAVVVPTGGGGLLAGVAVAIKTLNSNIKIIVCIIRYITRAFYGISAKFFGSVHYSNRKSNRSGFY